MDQQALGGVADAGPLALGVDNEPLRHVEVRRTIDVHVAVPLVVLEHRHARLGSHAADQALAASRDDQIDQLVQPQEMADRLPVRRLDQLYGIARQSRLDETIAEDGTEDAVGMKGLLAAAEKDGVAALDTKPGGVDGDIRTRFIDKEN